jgi:hypothetical protein
VNFDHLRTATGTWELKQGQKRALQEAHSAQGLIASLPVGSGKTLLSALLPGVIPCERPFLFTRASLVDKTYREFSELRAHFKIRQDLHICSYEDLSSQRFADLLESRKPDLLICDEAHSLKNKDSARTKRFLRYCGSHKPKVCLFSGTLLSSSVEDLWHLAGVTFWSKSPFPSKWVEVQDWAAVLDRDSFCPTPQQLARLARFAQYSTLDEAARLQERIQDGFQVWLAGQSGFVYETTSSCSASLALARYKAPEPADALLEAIRTLDQTWTDPDGVELGFAWDYGRVRQQLECGFYYRWVWPGGVDDTPWRTARNEYKKLLRDLLGTPEAKADKIDSPGQAEKWLHAQGLSDHPIVASWRAQKHKPEPPRETVWIDQSSQLEAIKQAVKSKSILWCFHRAQLDLAREKGLECYGPGEDFSERPRRALALSLGAHGTGRNLQAWDTAYLPSFPTHQVKIQQLFGRLHREGQLSDTVRWFVPKSPFWDDALGRARTNARWAERTSGEEQKILLCDLE